MEYQPPKLMLMGPKVELRHHPVPLAGALPMADTTSTLDSRHKTDLTAPICTQIISLASKDHPNSIHCYLFSHHASFPIMEAKCVEMTTLTGKNSRIWINTGLSKDYGYVRVFFGCQGYDLSAYGSCHVSFVSGIKS